MTGRKLGFSMRNVSVTGSNVSVTGSHVSVTVRKLLFSIRKVLFSMRIVSATGENGLFFYVPGVTHRSGPQAVLGKRPKKVRWLAFADIR